MRACEPTVHCTLSAFERGAALCGGLTFLAFAVAAVSVPGPLTLPWRLAACAACAALAWVYARLFFTRYSADADGVSWRSFSGAARRAPWASVVRVERPTAPSAWQPSHYVVTLDDGRTLKWAASYANARALHDRVAARLERGGAYRAHGDHVDDDVRRFTFGCTRRDRWSLLLAVAFPFAGLGLITVAGARALSQLDVELGPRLFFAALVPVPLAFMMLHAVVPFVALALLPGDDAVLTLDRRGLSLSNAPSPFRASWNDVLAVTTHPSRGVERVRIVTTAGEFTAPSDHHAPLRSLLRERVPAAVRDAFDRAEAARAGDVATVLAPGVYRHGLARSFGSPWVWDALALLFIGLLPFAPVALYPDAAAHLDCPARRATFAALAAFAVLLHRGSRALFSVTVSPEGCDWRGLRHRRRFAWSDVSAVTFPDATHPRLTLRLADGTRLSSSLTLFAARHELLAMLRDRLATTPHGDAETA